MIRIRTLGALDIEADAGSNPGAVLRQPARFALLVYLAVEGADGFVPRDRILATFWPDVLEHTARSRLRQALHYLRDQLGSIFERSGDHALRCADEWVACDAVEVVRAVGASAPERALERIRGPFLDGFHVDHASNALEDWICERRAALNRLALDATFTCAADHARQGDREVAMRLLERALEIAPEDDHVLARVVMGMQKYGDGTGVRRAMAVLGGGRPRFAPPHHEGAFRSRLIDLAEPDAGGLSEDDIAAIQAHHDRWFEAAATGDWHRALRDVCTPDTVLAPPGEPVIRGLDDVYAWYTRRPPAKRISHRIERITGAGGVAVVYGTFAVTVDADGRELTMNAAYTTGMVRRPDGQWLSFHSSWTPTDDGPVL